LYTGGRDGLICAWDLNLDLKNASIPDYDAKLPAPPASAFRQQVQAHTHWINDIALVQSNQALVSASSDITVKLWRPAAADPVPPQPIGLHSDYVKVLAVPSASSDWIASGGLDRMINLWDLNGGGQKLSIDLGEDEAGGMISKEKGSVYALGATNNMIASGGPESTVRVWDARTGKRITKLVGHTDNIRDVLVSQDGTTIMTASSDRTVKVWSTMAGRCMFTLTMHDASVWSLFSAHPDLSIFYSTDKNGLIVKTDTRDTIELDEGLSVAVAQEHEGVQKVVSAGDCLWTATSRPSISRWRDVNTDGAEVDVPENYSVQQNSIATGRFRMPSPSNQQEGLTRPRTTSRAKRRIPLKHVLRLSNTAPFPTLDTPENDKRNSVVERRGSKQEQTAPEIVAMEPVRSQPDFSIEGQNGLIKHVMLNDRKRVLTLDTAGEVVMWDLLKCVPIKSFGKRHIDDVKDEITTTATVANWCTVDTRTGSVAVILEDNTCFDAEMYADELDLDKGIEFKEDQRINLGKWVLRYLFSNLITEEIRRDQTFRSQLLSAHEEKKLQRENAPSNIQIPQTQVNGWHADDADAGPTSASTLRPTNGATKPGTPGLAIGVATPGSTHLSSPTKASAGANALAPTAEEGAPLDRTRSITSQPRQSTDRNSDYFSPSKAPNPDLVTPSSVTKAPATPSESAVTDDQATTPSGDGTPKETPSGKEAGLFGKKFSMRGMSFGSMKKIGRTQTNDKDKPAVVEEKEEGTESDSRSSKTTSSRNVDDNFLGTVQKIRFSYEDSIQQQIQGQQAHENGLPVPAIPNIELQSAIIPSLPAETPVLKPPANTTILIQEDRPEAGGVADLFEGTVGSLGAQCDLVEKAAPMWLGDVLLRNQTPVKEVVKISFILEPYQGSGLTSIASDGNNRLNANRMLRAKKILGYVAERIEPAPAKGEGGVEEERMKPEEYLELWCQNQVSPFLVLCDECASADFVSDGASNDDFGDHSLAPVAWRW
jgi:WD repeat-containing protein 48